jgi:hypothetical protein
LKSCLVLIIRFEITEITSKEKKISSREHSDFDFEPNLKSILNHTVYGILGNDHKRPMGQETI